MDRQGQWAETGVGALVLAAAVAFLIYALSHAGGGMRGSAYEISARFGQVGSLAAGADVRVAGVKVGSVSKIELDPKTFLARTSMQLDRTLKLPADSSARITSDGLLGGQHVAIEPGGATENLKPGGEIQNVQGAVDLFGLIGQFVRGSGASAAKPAANAAPSGGASASDPYPGGAR